MKSDRGKQSLGFVWLGAKAGRAGDLRLVLLFVLMTTVCPSATGQVGPDAPKTRPPMRTAPSKPPPVSAPSRGIFVRRDVLNALRNSFVRIPAGEFMMGSGNGAADERPVHRVRLSRSLEMCKYEVTQTQWEAGMGSNPSHYKGPNLPVENVSWEDVQQFLQKLNALNDGYIYRLPTEAEWEYGCRAGSTGDYAGPLDAMAWYGSNATGTTHPVGQKKPNSWGLYDMHGNVLEWCQDWFNDSYYTQSPSVDPRGPSAGSSRVLRGGNWVLGSGFLRSARRSARTPGLRENDLGFRLVRTTR